MEILVGSTGFVGSNLLAKHAFTKAFHRADIEQAFGTKPDLLVYAGVPAEMFLANTNPEVDFALIKNAFENIQKIQPKKLVLISTVAVYSQTFGVDERSEIDAGTLLPYGKNRLLLEQFVREYAADALIVRLPALFGENLKKNFLFDFINFVPPTLNQAKFAEFSAKSPLISGTYLPRGNGFYKCEIQSPAHHKSLISEFERLGFSALNFTDSRSIYQFYDLRYLWQHIETALQNDVRLLNLATAPIRVDELHFYLTGTPFKNELAKPPFNYDCKTIHARLFAGTPDGYIFSKQKVLEDIKNFVDSQKRRKELL